MMKFCSRNYLIQRIDVFNNNCGVFRKVLYGFHNLRRDMVEQPTEVNEIVGLLMEKNNRVGVVGSRWYPRYGGLGKIVLALTIAWDDFVSRQVIWLDIGKTADCLALINILIKALRGVVSF
ncbi:Hypothetical predicted protein, partial [Paramuricea clavata]